MSEKNVQIVREIYEAFGSGDVPGVLSKFAPDIHWMEAENFIYADRNPYIGPQAVLEGVFLRFVSEWNNFTVTTEAVLGVSDQVVTLGSYSGTYKATGKSVQAQMVHVWTIADGKAIKFQQHTDTKQFADAVVA
ncbi:MAG TPA: nuclear transport factor 2 family protein [Pyrinomonadaceae bacterium]|nr:nuclear transport factor 2 family protein [Pyrinomonadaceae bacterium]